jgi:hypothetical protein
VGGFFGPHCVRGAKTEMSDARKTLKIQTIPVGFYSSSVISGSSPTNGPFIIYPRTSHDAGSKVNFRTRCRDCNSRERNPLFLRTFQCFATPIGDIKIVVKEAFRLERAIKIRELNETINKRPNTNDNINYVVYNHIGVVNAATDKIWPLNLAEQQNVKLNKRKRKKTAGGHGSRSALPPIS